MDKIFQKIDKYLESDKNYPIILDVCESQQLVELRCHYNIGVEFVSASSFCKADSFPMMDAMFNELSSKDGIVFLTELSSFLKLKGEQELKQKLKQMLDLPIKCKLIILTYQCRDFLKFPDPRLYASSRIIFLEGQNSKSPDITLVADDVELPVDVTNLGIHLLHSMIEDDANVCTYLKTSIDKDELRPSLISLHFINTSYDALVFSYPELSGFSEDMGTPEQWSELLKEVNAAESWDNYLGDKFGGEGILLDKLTRLSSFTPLVRWQYFLALKYYGVGGDKYLSSVLNESNSVNVFVKKLFTAILDFNHKQKGFEDIYINRRALLKGLDGFVAELSSFCKQAETKGADGLYYLTDNTVAEKELIIKLVAQYHEELGNEQILTILKNIYPDLYRYVTPYRTGIKLLDEYIPLYKYSKLTNRILPELYDIVEEQAKKRDYNQVLKTRSFYVANAKKDNSALYFVDALGVEYLTYLDIISSNKGLKMNVQVGRCDLPSITSINKYFADDFKAAGCQVFDIKSLDELKHSGTQEYNFENTKLPIHLVKELSILADLINGIYTKLVNRNVEKVFVISDHGASRLAILHNCENKIEVKEKGLHSGRCCPISDTDEKPLNATEENDFWCLANYDLFKGGRKTGVEVHGGATLEEVAVPIIEFTLRGKEIDCHILPEYKVIYVSYKKIAVLKLYVDTISNNVSIVCNGKTYNCIATAVNRQYEVELFDITKKGQYSLDVLVNGSTIAKDLQFEVKKEGASEKKFF